MEKFVIQLKFSLTISNLFIVHNEAESVRDNSNQKVQHQDDIDENLKYPQYPNNSDISLRNFVVFSMVSISPVIVSWWLKISDSCPKYRNN